MSLCIKVFSSILIVAMHAASSWCARIYQLSLTFGRLNHAAQYAIGRLQIATQEQQHSTVNIKHNKEEA
jgi:hypothetical protein